MSSLKFGATSPPPSPGLRRPSYSRAPDPSVSPPKPKKKGPSAFSKPTNFFTLLRIYFLDGSSKVLQFTETSTAQDVLISLKSSLDLLDISPFALFRVEKHNPVVRIIQLNEKIVDVLEQNEVDNLLGLPSGTLNFGKKKKKKKKNSAAAGEDEGGDTGDHTTNEAAVRILFRTWVMPRYGFCAREMVFQDGRQRKTPNTAVWLFYMEASFMVMTGRYFLTEEESIILGCLRMQADSGDFVAADHSLHAIKLRVASAFPSPVCEKMRYYLANRKDADGTKLAKKVQTLYARSAGKSKIDAQIEYLHTLHTWCPFFGATFYHVQVQYDDKAHDPNSAPPVLDMFTAISQQAIFLITTSKPVAILRHPYRRILKWVAHVDKDIFTYWVLKPGITINQVEKDYVSKLSAFAIANYCDCVYLVTPSCADLEYQVRSYVKLLRNGEQPCLPNAPPSLMAPPLPELFTPGRHSIGSTGMLKIISQDVSYGLEGLTKGRGAAFNGVFKSIGGGPATENPVMAAAAGGQGSGGGLSSNVFLGSGMDVEEDDFQFSGVGGGGYGDDTASITNSIFKTMYKSTTSYGEYEDTDELDPIKAETIEELKWLAKKDFSDDEEDSEDEDGEDDEDYEEGEGDEEEEGGGGRGGRYGGEEDEDEEEEQYYRGGRPPPLPQSQQQQQQQQQYQQQQYQQQQMRSSPKVPPPPPQRPPPPPSQGKSFAR